MNPALRSALNRLPVPSWLHRFEHGTLRISGVVHEVVQIEIGSFVLSLQPGAVRISVVFQGGASAFVSKLFVDGGGLVWTDADRETVGERWSWQEGIAVMDDAPVGRVEGRKSRAVEAMSQHLSDVHVEVRVVPAEALRLTAMGGLAVNVPSGVVMTAVGCTTGRPDGLVLSRPMIVGFAGEGVELAMSKFQRLSRLLSVRIQRLTLHPNGQIELEGRGMRGMRRAVNKGLDTTADILSDMVREGASFAVIRPFLAVP